MLRRGSHKRRHRTPDLSLWRLPVAFGARLSAVHNSLPEYRLSAAVVPQPSEPSEGLGALQFSGFDILSRQTIVEQRNWLRFAKTSPARSQRCGPASEGGTPGPPPFSSMNSTPAASTRDKTKPLCTEAKPENNPCKVEGLASGTCSIQDRLTNGCMKWQQFERPIRPRSGLRASEARRRPLQTNSQPGGHCGRV